MFCIDTSYLTCVPKLHLVLFSQENPNHATLPERIPKPSEGSFVRSGQRKFPMLSVEAVNMFVEENKLSKERERQPRCIKQTKKRITEGTRLGER